jgi:hypothetical protein
MSYILLIAQNKTFDFIYAEIAVWQHIFCSLYFIKSRKEIATLRKYNSERLCARNFLINKSK